MGTLLLLWRRHQQLIQHIRNLTNKLLSQAKDLNRLQTIANTSSQQTARLQSDISTLRIEAAKVTELTDVVSDLRERLKKADQRCGELSASVERYVGMCGGLESRVTELIQSNLCLIGRLKSEGDERNKVIERLRRTNDSLCTGDVKLLDNVVNEGGSHSIVVDEEDTKDGTLLQLNLMPDLTVEEDEPDLQMEIELEHDDEEEGDTNEIDEDITQEQEVQKEQQKQQKQQQEQEKQEQEQEQQKQQKQQQQKEEEIGKELKLHRTPWEDNLHAVCSKGHEGMATAALTPGIPEVSHGIIVNTKKTLYF